MSRSSLEREAADFVFRCAALPDDTLRIYRFRGREALNQPIEFTIELVSADANLDLEAPIGEPAHLLLRGRRPDGERYSRHVHGIVARAVQLAAGIRYSVYEVTLVSTLSRLAFGQDSRIYQQLATPDVLRAVLADADIGTPQLQPLLHGSYAPRDYCVQYRESSLQFLQRLCEEDGICAFFDHQPDRDVLILGDGAHAFDSVPGMARLRHRDQPHLYEEGLFALREHSALVPGRAVLRDFRFQQPGLDMEASAAAGTFPDYCLYDFPGDYVDPALGQRLARLRLAEQEGGRRRYSGRSNVCALLPGYKFTLEGHRRRACNQEYLLVAVQHFGRQPQALPGALAHERSDDLALPGDALTYENQLECIPAEVEFRPPRRTPRPQVGGLQTAVVVGPPGEEVHCDEYGRVKVQFPWDRTDKRDDRSSCWIRVSQPFAGPGYGALFIPRIGHEVLVQFLHGDPDRPLIIGRVYNGENPLPYPLPAAKAISTLRSHSTPGGGGHNELRFDDRKGREELHLHAERNLSVHVGHDASSQVGGDSTTRIGGDSTIRIDANAIEHVAGDSSAKVGGSLITVIETGDHELRVGLGGCQTTMHGHSKTEITAGNSELLVLVGSHLTKAAGAVQIESGQDQLALRAHGPLQAHSQQKVELAAPQIVLTAAHKLTLRVGENSITLDESGIDLAGLQISSSAIGTHAISGALVSIN